MKLDKENPALNTAKSFPESKKTSLEAKIARLNGLLAKERKKGDDKEKVL